jgi:tetratricopeptide (TPR) repeat protein
MSSIIPGYEYDIFISYRQKDNKGDRWVSEFVEALKIELESTFKEEVSVYFDINPYDGLLETHDVDSSLKEKLDCLIFIPIISQTYCDPKCFAWQNEFVAFNKIAKEDQFGREIRLASGNVASRILPVKIHDLDPDDNTLLENELGGVLRCIEFIYKSAGVNRPLRANEDHPRDNINKTYYRDQINKTANAVKEIIIALKRFDQNKNKTAGRTIKAKHEKSVYLKTKPVFAAIFVLLLIVLGSLLITMLSRSSDTGEIKIAVLPFEKWFSDKDYYYLGDAIASQINSQLRDVKKFYVISFNSTRRYTASDIPPTRQISKECGANILVQGFVELLNYNKDIIIYVQLINARNNNLVWDKKKFEGKLDSLQAIRSKIVIDIAQELHVGLSPEEIGLIETGITKSSDAYKNFLSANEQNEAASLSLMGKKYNDSSSFELAIKMYNKAIMCDSSFALAYAGRAISRSWAYYTGSLPDQSNTEKCREDIEKALKIDPKLPEAQIAYGFYYYYCKKEYQKALECFKKASDIDPGNWQPVFYLAIIYRRIGEWSRSQALLTKVLKYNPQDALILTNIGSSYNYLRDYDSALIYQDMAIKIMPNWSSPYFNKIGTLLLKNGNTKEARIVIDTAFKETGNTFQSLSISLDIYDARYKEALIKTELSDPSDFIDKGDKLLYYARIHNYLDNSDLAKTYYDSARVFFIKKMKEDPENPKSFIQAGLAYAGLKDGAKAIEAGRKALSLSNNALTRNNILIDLAKIYITVGDYENGFRQIENLLKTPSDFSIKLLQLDPVWKSIKERPEFKKILADYSEN